jgi:DNA-binding CsgD family transcriptional regulator
MAAQLWELAIDATPPGEEPERRRRTLDAADAQFSSGALDRAAELLQGLVDQVPAGDERAAVLMRLAGVSRDLEEVNMLTERALREAVSDGARSRAQVGLAWVTRWLRDVDCALGHGRLALQHAERVGERRLLLQALGPLAFLEMLSGRSTPRLLERAIELQAASDDPGASGFEVAPGFPDPRFTLALRLIYQGRLDEARAGLERLVEEAEGEGDAPASLELQLGLVHAELRAGKWQQAVAYAAAADDLAEQIGRDDLSTLAKHWRALVDAHLGRVVEARATAEVGGELARKVRATAVEALNLSVLGFLELSVGNERGALAFLRPTLDWLAEKKQVLVTHPSEPYALEALIGAGELEEARSLIVRFEDNARVLESPWSLATAARCRGLVAAAERDLDSASTALKRSLELREGEQWPFERARTLLVLGRVQRRQKARAAAKESLEQALATFEALPAPLWAERTREELRRLGLRRGGHHELTATEQRVAELVASGLKNREVAAQLFMSPKTVEANLARAYRKLGIRSRAELGARLARVGSEPAQT